VTRGEEEVNSNDTNLALCLGVPVKGGAAVVGRFAVTGGAEGEDLPDVLFAGGEEVREVVGFGAEIADARVGGQRADVEEGAGGASEAHVLHYPGWG